MGVVDGNGSVSLIDRVCRAAVELLQLSGAGLSLIVDGQLRGSSGVSEAGIRVVQELQLSLGEGPCVDAWARIEAVLEPDLADPRVVRWPTFAQAAVNAGVLAVFAVPLHQGAIRIGVLALYRDRVGTLSADELAKALVLADVATQAVLGLQAGAPEGSVHELLAGQPPHWAEIHQATGMTSVQLGVGLDDAFVRLRAHAFASERTLRDVATAVVARRLRLDGTAQ